MSKGATLLNLRAKATLDDYVVDLAWSPSGDRLAVAGGEGRIFAASLTDNELAARQIGEHVLGALAVAWQPHGETFVSSGQDGTVHLFDAAGSNRKTLRPAKVATEQLAFAPDGKMLAMASGKQLTLWSPDGELLRSFAPLDSSVHALAWDKPGRDVCVATHGGLTAYRVESGVKRQYKWPGTCLSVAYSPNGKYLISGMADGAVHFWYLATAKDSQMSGYPGRVTLTLWDGSGRYLATGAGNEIVVWDFGGRGPEGSRPIQLSGHTDRVECMAYQPNGGHLASGGRDWRLSLWLPGKAKLALDAHLTDSEPSVLCWSPDGKLLAVGERKGVLSIYELIIT